LSLQRGQQYALTSFKSLLVITSLPDHQPEEFLGTTELPCILKFLKNTFIEEIYGNLGISFQFQ
jgi:hypothetical protein